MTEETKDLDNSNEQTLAAMSDEDFLNAVGTQPVTEAKPDEQAEVIPAVQAENVTTETTAEEAPATPTEQATDTSSTDSPQQDQTKADTQTQEVNHKDFYEKLTKPFKANGREIQVTNPDDMISLMQKGTDYVKKMTELKPLKQLNALLTQHGITQEDLGLLIELKQKKPEAIAKVVKDSGVDVYGLNVDEAEKYVPATPQAPQTNDALDATIEELKISSSVFQQTIQIVGNQWDESSRSKIAEHPQLLRIIDAQVADGTFAKIDSVMQYERALGRLVGLTDLEAYVEIERKLQASQPAQIQVPAQAQPVQPVVTPQQQQVNAQRKSAAPPRVVKETTSSPPINSPALSDEEFLKQLSSQGLR